jgi:hypothetical protein
MGINLNLFFVQEELRQMSRYLDIVASALEVNFSNIDSAYEKTWAEGTSEDLSDDYIEWVISQHQDELIEAGEDFPQLLLISFVILWYSFVEQKLLNLCEELNLTVTISAKGDENFGKGIRRARKFLLHSKNYEINQKHWQELVYISKLRNLIVHEGRTLKLSYIKPDKEAIIYKTDNGLDLYVPIDKDLYEYMERHGLFKVSSMLLNIVPSIDYCKELVSFGGEIFRKLYKDLKSVE